MSFTTLAVIGLAGIFGPLLALPTRWHLPVLLGELHAGILLGPTVFGALQAADPEVTFLSGVRADRRWVAQSPMPTTTQTWGPS
jgi:Kef-type K+ transport system membrane component KefB